MVKITKALIMAAGLGSRIRPMSNKIPKPLIKVKGIPMIETIIEGMLNNGITEIHIVVGYMKEKFYYLKDKYEEVSFITNDEYESRGAISSFYAAKDILNDNFIISDGNFNISDDSIFDPNIKHTTYLYRKYETHTDRWGFVFKEDSKKIVKIIRDIDAVEIENKLFGVSFWLKEDLLKLVKKVEKEYDNPKYLDRYHDGLVNEMLDDLTIVGREVTNKQINEINELKDLVRIDKKYLEILKREEETKFNKVVELAEVLSLNSEQLVGVYESPGRSTNNKNYVIETEDEKYFLRIAGEGTELFSDRAIEKNAYEELAGTDIVDEVYFLDADSGMKISKFYENSRILNINNEEQIKKFLNKLKQIHTGNFNFIKEDNIFDRMIRYEKFVEDLGGKKHFGDGLDEIIKELYQYKKVFDKKDKYTSIHGDCSPNNTMVLEDGEIKLIDLEFVSMGDPYTDLANFAHDGEMNPKQLLRLLRLYLGKRPTREQKYKIFIYAATISIMWYSWAVYKMTVEPQDLYKFKGYRDSYYDWYKLMYKEAHKYK